MAGTLTISTLSDGTNSTSSTNCIQGSAKAWVNFLGTTGSVNASYNVSSVTRNGTGDYTLNFTNALANANYAVATTPPVVSDQGSAYSFGYYTTTSISNPPTTKSTTQLRLLCRREANVDVYSASVSIFSS